MSSPPIVLYVEDEPTDAFLMRRAFAKAGIESSFQTVAEGRAAIDYLSGVPKDGTHPVRSLPAVVLLDLNLPDVHGFEVLQWIRKHPEHTNLPVVIFSSSGRPEDRAKAAKLGADDYWEKPNSGNEFTRVVEKLKAHWMDRLD